MTGFDPDALLEVLHQHEVRYVLIGGLARPGHADALQHGLELRAAAALPGGDHDRQRLLPLLAGQMDLGRQPAPRAAQPVIAGLSGDAARRLGLQIPLFRAPAAC